jgi:RNA-binding protein Luc7-like 2
MDLLKQELDELMGKDRNMTLKEKLKRKEKFTDVNVCKYNLVSLCPHNLFPNTKFDLGECKKRHDEFFRQMLQADEDRYFHEKRYIQETINLFDSLLVGVDARIKK